jgi:hypothetical protein
MSRWLASFCLLLFSTVSAGAQDINWRAHKDPEFGHRIDLPLGAFEIREENPGRLLLQEVDGLGQITVYGQRADGQALSEIEESLAQSGLVDRVTYRAGGKSWFVLSGYYEEEGQVVDLIFYVKLMLSRDREKFSVMAISYPSADKERFDPVVERLEGSLRPPS